jgi:hypothetical protein
MPFLWATIAERLRRRDEDPIQRARELAADYQRTFAGDAGQRVLADLLRRTGVMLSTAAPGEDGTTGLLLREGQRQVGLYIVRQVNAEPDAALRLAQHGNTASLFPED